MQNIIILFRYVVFGFFIVFNSVIASVAVWNITFVPSKQTTANNVDAFLIFVGSSGLIVVFSIIFTELGRRNAFTSRLWFELIWTGVCALLQLSGAIASSVTVPSGTCDVSTTACNSAKVLIAFAWMNTIILLVYVTSMTTFLLIYSKEDPRIWQLNIHNLPDIRKPTTTSPPSPILPTLPSLPTLPALPTLPGLPNFVRRPASIVAPQPRKPPAPTTMYSYRSGLSPDYRIEHFQPPESFPPFETSDSPPPVKLQPNRPSSLYPEFLSPSLASSDIKPSPSISRQPPSVKQSPTPPPLGKWPRADIMSLPSATKPTPTLPKGQISRSASRRPPSPSPPPAQLQLQPRFYLMRPTHLRLPLDLDLPVHEYQQVGQ
ncbi:hypothetical protein VNI00_008197 [Paramarasmius palmivorus]|uniref:MARVEL domain-containing protein n=1 Tax=Paramarasmius palmivorus TaxID=297713 RepID=A0AAW0CUT6_9AGAR